MLVTQAEDAQRLGISLFSLTGDLELAIESTQSQVAAGDIAYQCQQDSTAPRFAGQNIGLSGFIGTTYSPPQIDFPRGIERSLVATVIIAIAGE